MSLPTTREATFLAILLNGPRYGRELSKAYKERTGRTIPAGSLYVTLDRMEDAGWVKSWLGEETHERGGNRRRYFRLTASGHRAYDLVCLAIQPRAEGRPG